MPSIINWGAELQHRLWNNKLVNWLCLVGNSDGVQVTTKKTISENPSEICGECIEKQNKIKRWRNRDLPLTPAEGKVRTGFLQFCTLQRSTDCAASWSYARCATDRGGQRGFALRCTCLWTQQWPLGRSSAGEPFDHTHTLKCFAKLSFLTRLPPPVVGRSSELQTFWRRRKIKSETIQVLKVHWFYRF